MRVIESIKTADKIKSIKSYKLKLNLLKIKINLMIGFKKERQTYFVFLIEANDDEFFKI